MSEAIPDDTAQHAGRRRDRRCRDAANRRSLSAHGEEAVGPDRPRRRRIAATSRSTCETAFVTPYAEGEGARRSSSSR